MQEQYPINVMIDLETWGLYAGCDIRSIGAVTFDPIMQTVGNGYLNSDGDDNHIVKGQSFYEALDNPFYEGLNKYKHHGFHRHPETVKWWKQQSPEALAAFANPVDMEQGLLDFKKWFEAFGDDTRVWANDPHFDVAILEYAYYWFGIKCPWNHRAPRSMRTLIELSGMRKDIKATYGVQHHALHDAIAQSMTVCKAVKLMKSYY
jgi:hypothetical protein